MKKIFLILIFSVAAFFACKKADSVLGLDVQPENDLLYGSYSDTSTIRVRTVLDDSLYSSLNNLGIYQLGSYEDPVFGRSDASIYTSFILKDNITNVNAGSKPQMDSVVLSLAYAGDFYGDTTDALTVNVHMLHLGSPLSPDSLYHSYDTYHYDPQDITEGGNGMTFYPHPHDSVQVGTTVARSKPQLRIRLDKTWFEEYLLLHANVNLVNSATMQALFKGLYITTKGSSVYSPDYGSILRFMLYDNATCITFYFHNFTTPAQTLQFTCGGSTAHFDHYDHDYGTAHDSIKHQLSDTLSKKSHENIFVQSMAGLGAKIQMPYLRRYCDSGAISVTRADLVLKVDQGSEWYSSAYQPPLGLWMTAYDSTGKPSVQLLDAGTYWFGGAYDGNYKQYTFNIARQINNICNGKIKNYGFFLYAGQSSAVAYRAVLGGSYDPKSNNNNPYHMQLKITYTKLYKE